MWIGSVIAMCLLSVAAMASEASPAGVWKWRVQGRQGGQGFEQTVRLYYEAGKLTGIMPGRDAGQFSVPDTPIADASFKNGTVRFSITREFNGQKFTTKYEGKVEGDTIIGTFERVDVGGKLPPKSDWNARRQG